jgi:DNA-binding transcriptional ArsR family regulator
MEQGPVKAPSVSTLAGLRRLLLQTDGVSAHAASVYCALRFFAGPRGCFPAHERIAEHCKLSVRTVQRQLEALRRRGLITWRRAGRHGANSYRLLLNGRGEVATCKESLHVSRDVEPIRSALRDVGLSVAKRDPLPARLAEVAEKAGGTVQDMALWIADKARERRIRSAGFFLAVGRQDFKAWLAQLEQSRTASRAAPAERLSEFRVARRSCPHCGGPAEEWVEDDRWGRCGRCGRAIEFEKRADVAC